MSKSTFFSEYVRGLEFQGSEPQEIKGVSALAAVLRGCFQGTFWKMVIFRIRVTNVSFFCRIQVTEILLERGIWDLILVTWGIRKKKVQVLQNSPTHNMW